MAPSPSCSLNAHWFRLMALKYHRQEDSLPGYMVFFSHASDTVRATIYVPIPLNRHC